MFLKTYRAGAVAVRRRGKKMKQAEKKLVEIMDAYDRGEARAVEVALEVSKTMGLCSQEIYNRAEKILEASYYGMEPENKS